MVQPGQSASEGMSLAPVENHPLGFWKSHPAEIQEDLFKWPPPARRPGMGTPWGRLSNTELKGLPRLTTTALFTKFMFDTFYMLTFVKGTKTMAHSRTFPALQHGP